MPAGANYYYAVKAFNECGNSSGFLDEVEVSFDDEGIALEKSSRSSINSSRGGGCFVISVTYMKDKH